MENCLGLTLARLMRARSEVHRPGQPDGISFRSAAGRRCWPIGRTRRWPTRSRYACRRAGAGRARVAALVAQALLAVRWRSLGISDRVFRVADNGIDLILFFQGSRVGAMASGAGAAAQGHHTAAEAGHRRAGGVGAIARKQRCQPARGRAGGLAWAMERLAVRPGPGSAAVARLDLSAVRRRPCF